MENGDNEPSKKRPRVEVEEQSQESNDTSKDQPSTASLPSTPQQARPPSTSTTSSTQQLRLESSIFGKKPDEDIVLQVSEFIWRNISAVRDGSHLEVEGKLGLIIDKHTNSRIRLPVMTETVLMNDGQYRFDSNMTMDQHAHFNRTLNALVQRPGATVRYVHTKEVDHYHETGSRRVRVSIDQKTQKVKEVLVKQRVADLEIHLPNSPLDFRISISMEVPAPQPPQDSVSRFRRHKDRLSYSHQVIRVDLTQVRQFDGRDRESNLTHECEVEFIRAACLIEEKEKRQNQKPNNFAAYVDVFLNNLRYLSRKAIPH
ncbi:CYTH-like domain-containing protein [Powellomyces hirtus]|nr:CYTH-like domain-containing protein [Powellomyces hirtus]